MEYDFNNPEERENYYALVDPHQPHTHHSTLRRLFRLEMNYRENSADQEYYENLYWCGFLLYRIGDFQDVEMMWKAKHINMDTGCGFDGQNLVGAGVTETIEFCLKNNLIKIADYINQMNDAGEFDDLDEWFESKITYFYSD